MGSPQESAYLLQVAKQQEDVIEKEAYILGTGKFGCFVSQFYLQISLRNPSVVVILHRKCPRLAKRLSQQEALLLSVHHCV